MPISHGGQSEYVLLSKLRLRATNGLLTRLLFLLVNWFRFNGYNWSKTQVGNKQIQDGKIKRSVVRTCSIIYVIVIGNEGVLNTRKNNPQVEMILPERTQETM